ncbi:MAG: hypothetical protein AB1486_23400 [Planctomycetota bacterium]
MFIPLVLATLVLALAVGFVAVTVFTKPIRAILDRLIPDAISVAWLRYLKFAMCVVGIAGGVSIRNLERYIGTGSAGPVELTGQRWALELLDTAIGSIGAITWMLLVFFVIALVAYVIVRIFEMRKTPKEKNVPGVKDGAPAE